MFDRATEVFVSGGPVMFPLGGISILLWLALGLRWQLLRQGVCRESPMRGKIALESYSAAIHSGVAVAPLLGLLGTVSGMVDTFAALNHAATDAGRAAIAGGISEALVSTEVGLMVAVPAFVLGRVLDAKAARLRGEITELVSASATPAGSGAGSGRGGRL